MASTTTQPVAARVPVTVANRLHEDAARYGIPLGTLLAGLITRAVERESERSMWGGAIAKPGGGSRPAR